MSSLYPRSLYTADGLITVFSFLYLHVLFWFFLTTYLRLFVALKKHGLSDTQVRKQRQDTQPSEVKYSFPGQLRTQSCVTTSSKERINSNFTHTYELQSKIRDLCFNSQKFVINSQLYTIWSILSLAGDIVQALGTVGDPEIITSVTLRRKSNRYIKKQKKQNTATLSL